MNMQQQSQPNLFTEDVPSEFICPITMEVMVYPLMTRTGLNFERNAILNWLYSSSRCPLTRQPLQVSDLSPNHQLEAEIQQWRESKGIAVQKQDESDVIPSTQEQQLSSEALSMMQPLSMNLNAMMARSVSAASFAPSATDASEYSSMFDDDSVTSDNEDEDSNDANSYFPFSTTFNNDMVSLRPGEGHRQFLLRILDAAETDLFDDMW